MRWTSATSPPEPYFFVCWEARPSTLGAPMSLTFLPGVALFSVRIGWSLALSPCGGCFASAAAAALVPAPAAPPAAGAAAGAAGIGLGASLLVFRKAMTLARSCGVERPAKVILVPGAKLLGDFSQAKRLSQLQLPPLPERAGE